MSILTVAAAWAGVSKSTNVVVTFAGVTDAPSTVNTVALATNPAPLALIRWPPLMLPVV